MEMNFEEEEESESESKNEEEMEKLTDKDEDLRYFMVTIPKEEKAKPCSNNQVNCPCAKEGCPRHGKCSECVAHHKACAAHASADHLPKLPACLRGIAWQA